MLYIRTRLNRINNFCDCYLAKRNTIIENLTHISKFTPLTEIFFISKTPYPYKNFSELTLGSDPKASKT